MKLRTLCSVMALAFGLTATLALASPKKESKSPCSQSAQKASDKAPCSKPCDKPCGKNAKTVADSEQTPCSGHKATTVADQAPCSKSAKTVADEKPCDKPCDKPCGKNAKTVADKAPCGAGCGKDCKCKKGAKLTAEAGDVIPCPVTGKPIKKGDCPISKKVNATLASFPSMNYRVGSETMGCSKSAAALAEKNGTTLQYVVGDEAFENQGDAKAKLTALLEENVEALQSLQYVVGDNCGRCPMTAKSQAKKSGATITYRVGGVDFDSKDDAEKAVTLVADAVSKVKMSYKVGKRTFCCTKSATATAEKTGEKMTYVVGENETACKISAALMHAEAKARAAVEAAVKITM